METQTGCSVVEAYVVLESTSESLNLSFPHWQILKNITVCQCLQYCVEATLTPLLSPKFTVSPTVIIEK